MLKQVIYLKDGLRAGFMIDDKVYDADTGELVEGYETIKDLSWNELSDAVLSEAGKKSTRCTLQAEPSEEKEEKKLKQKVKKYLKSNQAVARTLAVTIKEVNEIVRGWINLKIE